MSRAEQFAYCLPGSVAEAVMADPVKANAVTVIAETKRRMLA